MTPPDVDAAEAFLVAHARVLDRRLFARLFRDGPPEPVRDAVAAHRNPDGGFGHALEPDGRTPGSQTPAVEIALRVLHWADAWDAELVGGACDFLQAVAPEEGGAAFVLPGVDPWPHAPWWREQPGLPPSLAMTGQIAADLHARAVEHPWLERADEVLFDLIARISEPNAYELLGAVRFLDTAPDAERAAATFASVAEHVAAAATLDPGAPGETHGPLFFAPEPGSRARQVWDEATIAAHLDHLAAAQRDDGGWMFDWPAWSPAQEADWRGFVTVEALRTLRANGRL